MTADDQPDYFVRITFIRPSTGERVVSPAMTKEQARAYWNAMPRPLQESAVIQELTT